MVPPYRVETNENPPIGTIPTKTFRVLLFLYEENVTCWAFGLFGIWLYISVASIIRVWVEYFCKNIHECVTEQYLGNALSSFNLKKVNLIQL